MSNALFVTATGTDVGKTFVTALLLKKLREEGVNAGYYKAALSGAILSEGRLIPGDADYVCRIAAIPENPASLVSYCYQTAVSPHLAAKLEGNPPELATIQADFKKQAGKYEYLCMEGSGGIVCPLRIEPDETLLLTDMIKALHLPVVIVASALLGTINSTVLTVEYARARGIAVKGIILNLYDDTDRMHRDNKTQIERLTGVPVVACVSENAQALEINTQTLRGLFMEVYA